MITVPFTPGNKMRRLIIVLDGGIVTDVHTDIPGTIDVQVLDVTEDGNDDERAAEDEAAATAALRDPSLRMIY